MRRRHHRPTDPFGRGRCGRAREAAVTDFIDNQLAGFYGRGERWYITDLSRRGQTRSIARRSRHSTPIASVLPTKDYGVTYDELEPPLDLFKNSAASAARPAT